MKRHYYYFLVSTALFVGAFIYSVVERSNIPNKIHRTNFGTSYVDHTNLGRYQVIILFILILAEIALFAGNYSKTKSIVRSILVCMGIAILFMIVEAITSA